MRAINYEQVDVPSELIIESLKVEGDLIQGLASCYPDNSKADFHAELALSQQLSYILWGVSGEVKGKTILDLGCGSNEPGLEAEGIRDSMYEPWLCRGLYKLGANPIGVDIGDLSREEFRYYQVDLTTPDSLSEIPDKSVDLANARQLFSSVFLEKCDRDPEDLRRNIHSQLKRILKSKAVFLYWD